MRPGTSPPANGRTEKADGRSRSTERARRFVSAVIVVILGLQTTAVLLRTDRSFPFQHYPMYAEPHGEGEHVEVELTVYARFADGLERRLSALDVGLPFFLFRRQFVQAILDEKHDKIARFLAPYQDRVGERIVGLRVENYPIIVTRSGPKDAPAATIKTLEIEPPATGSAS